MNTRGFPQLKNLYQLIFKSIFLSLPFYFQKFRFEVQFSITILSNSAPWMCAMRPSLFPGIHDIRESSEAVYPRTANDPPFEHYKGVPPDCALHSWSSSGAPAASRPSFSAQSSSLAWSEGQILHGTVSNVFKKCRSTMVKHGDEHTWSKHEFFLRENSHSIKNYWQKR